MKNRRDWHKFPKMYTTLDPHILRIVDMVDGVVIINTQAAPGANVIYLHQQGSKPERLSY